MGGQTGCTTGGGGGSGAIRACMRELSAPEEVEGLECWLSLEDS
jgi:hypothetical protein